MVDADAALLDEPCDRRILRRRFEQFDLGLAQFEEGRAHLLVGHFLDRVTFQAQYVLPVGNRFIEALYCNAKMLNVRYFHNFKRFIIFI